MNELENEYKLVLKNPPESVFSDFDSYVLTQIYLKGNRGRLRRTIKNNIITYEFNQKFKTKAGLIEIEKPISADAYESIANEWAQKSLTKRRFKKLIDNDQWDVDYFINGNDVYFHMAEVETSTLYNIYPVEKIPANILPYVLYNVPQKNNKIFTSSRLENITYTIDLLKKLGK